MVEACIVSPLLRTCGASQIRPHPNPPPVGEGVEAKGLRQPPMLIFAVYFPCVAEKYFAAIARWHELYGMKNVDVNAGWCCGILHLV